MRLRYPCRHRDSKWNAPPSNHIRIFTPATRMRHAMDQFVFILFSAALTMALCLSSGCVAINVGKPKVITDAHDVQMRQSEPVSVEVVSIAPQTRQIGSDKVSVALNATVSETFEKRAFREIWTIRKRKRLAIGLFPGAAETYLMPDGALTAATFAQQTATGEYRCNPLDERLRYAECHLGGLLTCGALQLAGTVNSLLLEWFEPWECAHDLVDPDYVVASPRRSNLWTASESPKLRVIAKYADELGIHTCMDGSGSDSSFLSHLGLVGIHKYVAVFVDGPEKGPPAVVGTETRRRNMTVNGPLIAELSIPDLNYRDWKRIAAHETQTTFQLPVAPRACTTEAIVKFRAVDTAQATPAGDLTRQALSAADGQTYRFVVSLAGGGNGDFDRQRTRFYEILAIRPSAEGQYSVRVEIKDKSRTFSIGREIEGEVRRLIREDYYGKHPETPIKDIREAIKWETEGDGSILVYTAWAFSIRPVKDGWKYDHEARRGWMRLRISGGMPAEEAKRWAQENISAIVSDKNVALEVGKAPPPGATYRSLDESFEDGILTVEFEAIQ